MARGSLTGRLKFIAVARGQARLTSSDTAEPVILEPGDVAILNNQAWLEVRGGPEDEVPQVLDVSRPSLLPPDTEGADTILGGHIALNPIGQSLLLQALPPVGHIRGATTAAPLRTRIDQLVQELTSNRIGSAFAVRQHGQLLVLDILRVYLDQADLPQGWLRLLTDQHLHPAVTLMHSEPGNAWRLETLAQSAAMSRTAFATRFRDVAGMPPLTYLNQWRMMLAQRALRGSDEQIRTLAASLGYASESAFSTAFKRETGEPPLRYRKRVREEDAAVLR